MDSLNWDYCSLKMFVIALLVSCTPINVFKLFDIMLCLVQIVAKKYFLKKMPQFCGQKNQLEKMGHKTVAKFSF